MPLGSDIRLAAGPDLEHACQSISDEVLHYLQAGENDPFYRAWPGSDIFEGASRAYDELRGALVQA